MTPPPTAIRGKEVCMLEADWHDFGLALAEAYPQARYYLRPDYINDPEAARQTPAPPKVQLHRYLFDISCDPFHTDRRYMVFDPDWQPQFRRYHPIGEPENWHWSMLPPPHPYVMFHPGGYLRELPVPHPGRGEIHFYATPKDKGHMALAARFFRLFGKFATNKKGLVRVRVPSLEVTIPVGPGSSAWCGHHAIEWARQNPDGVLFYTGARFGIRPTGEVMGFLKARPKTKAKTA